MNNFSLSYGRLPVMPAILAFAFAFLFDFIPFPADSFFWLPKFSAMVLIFLALYRPQTFGLLSAFIVGLLIDAGTATPLGSHALAYVCAVFLIQFPSYMKKLNTPVRQTIGVFMALLFIQIVLLFVHAVSRRQWVHMESMAAAVSGMLLWPLADKILKNLFFRFSR
ncbi:MAG: rod shape-determining protein MreD [Neisseria sp.]|uniref:rod shape-determining protein MreD n=1 Tax=Neisseria sp. TaxID=192066 RepID=UPI0026DD993C|nr:rod shape-determining protein MreD [Neisseria sp.]MDO4641121.1 rod shape-determining protein MreD [Neisseria sp.]